jgi:hypothetical protein
MDQLNRLLAEQLAKEGRPPMPPVPPGVQQAADIARRMNPVMVLLDLMTQTQPLNEGEDNQLKLKRLQSGTTN